MTGYPYELIERLVQSAGSRPDMMVRFLAAAVMDACCDPLAVCAEPKEIFHKAHEDMGFWFQREADKLERELAERRGFAND